MAHRILWWYGAILKVVLAILHVSPCFTHNGGPFWVDFSFPSLNANNDTGVTMLHLSQLEPSSPKLQGPRWLPVACSPSEALDGNESLAPVQKIRKHNSTACCIISMYILVFCSHPIISIDINRPFPEQNNTWHVFSSVVAQCATEASTTSDSWRTIPAPKKTGWGTHGNSGYEAHQPRESETWKPRWKKSGGRSPATGWQQQSTTGDVKAKPTLHLARHVVKRPHGAINIDSYHQDTTPR